MSRDRLEMCFNQCSRPAWRLAWSWLGDAHEAFDCVQQAFVVAAGKTHEIPPDNPWPWFRQVVINEARNARRKHRPVLLEETTMPDSARGPAQTAAENDTSAQLLAALATLPDAEREAITLTHLNGMTHAEAAKALGMPVKTVSSHVGRGLERLKLKLGGRETAMFSGFAAALPPGGWEAATAAWKATAFSTLGAVAATGAATTGVILMNKTLAAAGMLLALGIGLGGGALLTRSLMDPPPQVTRATPEMQDNLPLPNEKPQARAADAPIPPAEPADREVADTQTAALREALAEAERERDQLKQHAATLEAELRPLKAERAEREPTFTFGRYGQIDGVRNSNWKELATANREVVACIREIREAQRKGEQPARETQVRLQRYTETVRKFEYETIGVIKSFARHNGELTHPLTVANLFAGELAAAGLPFTDAQRADIERLGLAYEADFEAAQNLYSQATPRCAKLLDEYTLKGAFMDALYALLTSAQHAHLVDPATHRIAFCDLHCPTLMLIHTSPILTGQDTDELRGKLEAMLKERYSLNEDQLAALQPLLLEWSSNVAAALVPVPQNESRFYTYEQGRIALAATAALAAGMQEKLQLNEVTRVKLMDSYDVYVPRLLQ